MVSLQCSFIPKLCVTIHTKFEDNPGTTENVIIRCLLILSLITLFLRHLIKYDDISFITIFFLNSQCLGLTGEKLVERTVDFIDIAYDEVSPKHYKEEEVYITLIV